MLTLIKSKCNILTTAKEELGQHEGFMGIPIAYLTQGPRSSCQLVNQESTR